MKIPVSSFLSYLWSYLAYRDVLYIKLKLLRFCFDLMLSFLAPGSIFVEQLRQEVVSFVFGVAQTVFVPNFYIPLIWQLFFSFLWIFSSYAKELMHMISRKKENVYLIPFHRTEFSNSFCQRFFYPPFRHIAETHLCGTSVTNNIKPEGKKTIQILDMIAQQILILELKMIKQGQNKISRALIWGKVGLCRLNMTRDMIKNVKTVIFKKCQILHFLAIL